ncbi:hypothetical protein BKA58DRAFT_83433 [Alternaria rosae]|uniref:uncharacterized protein n=1 Tax=Alternaria rosae TaxID=1187941 RepID=UPI001E8EF3C1|nr:uncharacterized protein BKA58DRAFT_83433 [Alternaria rosae]KAH6877825.1 hypothetical protein BKA58DRAFT_83433 [Alternaria rosae]
MYTAIALIALLLTIATTTTTISALPTHHLSRRGLPGAYYTCTKSNFAGECSWTQPNTECHIQGSPGGIASLGPDQGSTCALYQNFSCTGDILQKLTFPGIATDMPKFGSFKCVEQGSSGGSRKEVEQAVVLTELEAADLAVEDFGVKSVAMEGREEGMIGLQKGIYY